MWSKSSFQYHVTLYLGRSFVQPQLLSAIFSKSSFSHSHKVFHMALSIKSLCRFFKFSGKIPFNNRFIQFPNLSLWNKRLFIFFARLYFYTKNYSAMLRYNFFTCITFTSLMSFVSLFLTSMWVIFVLQVPEL